jgi:hypothetical protein
MSNAQSIDSLRELNAKLLAEIAELRKEKVMRETPNQEAPPISQNPMSTTCNERKNGQGLIQEMSLSTEENHVTKISKTARRSRKSCITLTPWGQYDRNISAFGPVM